MYNFNRVTIFNCFDLSFVEQMEREKFDSLRIKKGGEKRNSYNKKLGWLPLPR